MRNWVTVLLAVAAALALVSCAGLDPAAERAADLYDMDSYLVALGRLGNAPADAPALPLPPVTDSSSPGPSEIGVVSRPAAASPGTPVALPAPVPPAPPAARTTAPRPAAAAPAAATTVAPIPGHRRGREGRTGSLGPIGSRAVGYFPGEEDPRGVRPCR